MQIPKKSMIAGLLVGLGIGFGIAYLFLGNQLMEQFDSIFYKQRLVQLLPYLTVAAIVLCVLRLIMKERESQERRSTIIREIELLADSAIKTGAEVNWDRYKSAKSKVADVDVVTLDDAILSVWYQFIMSIPFDSTISEEARRNINTSLNRLSLSSAVTEGPRGAKRLLRGTERILEICTYNDLASGTHSYPNGQHIDADLVLKKNERMMFEFGDVQLMKGVSHRKTSTQSQGMSVRVAKGVYVRSGTGGAESHSEKVDEVVDYGKLFVTDQAIIFCGSQNNIRIPLQHVAVLDQYADAIQIFPENKERVIFILWDPKFAAFLIRALIKTDSSNASTA